MASSTSSALELAGDVKEDFDKATADGDEPPSRLSVALLLPAILFSGTHWGLVSFGASTLNEVEGLSFTEIGALVPTFGAVYILSTFLLGMWETAPQKLLLLGGTLLNGGGLMLATTGNFPFMVTGYAMIGVGYAPYTILPYSQVKLMAGRNKEVYERWYLAVEIAFVLSFSMGRLMMMAFVSYVDDEELRWKAAFYVVVIGQAFFFTLILLFGRYARPVPRRPADGEDKEEDGGLTYVEKLRALYLNPVAAMLLLGSLFNAFTSYGLAAWAPTIALHRYEDGDRSEATINLTVSLAVFVAWPVGMLLTLYAIRVARRIKGALRATFLFVSLAAVSITIYASVTDYFYLHIGTFVAFAAFANLPGVLYKTLPLLLGYDAAVAIFALSRFTLAYSVAGDIAGWLLTGVLIDEAGFDTAVWVLAGGAWIAAACWAVLTAWTLGDSGPVQDLHDAEEASLRATARWKRLRSFTMVRLKKKRVVSAAIGASRAGRVLEWLVYRDLKAQGGSAGPVPETEMTDTASA